MPPAITPTITSDATTRKIRWADALCDAAAVALIVAALLTGLRMTRDLPGAYDPDHFRDIAQAQTVLDGHPLSDPYYRGEWAWYNPLLAWTIAAGSRISGMPVETFHVHEGALVNLLGPVGFYLLAVRLAGRKAAVIGLAIFLFFITGAEHSWASATYSPWLFADNFSLGFFFLASLALLWANESASIWRAGVAGALIGITFLAHAAPALILAATVTVMWFRRPGMLVAAGLAAFVLALPFFGPLAMHYRFHVLHAVPLTYQYAPVSREGFAGTLQHYGWAIAAALGGLWCVRSGFATAWLLISFGFTCLSIAGIGVLLPAFHFWLYTTAALSLLSGALLGRIVWNPAMAVAATSLLVIWNWHAYTTRPDLQLGRFLAGKRVADHIAAASFLRTVTTADDVVLGADGSVRLIIGPAGRRTVAPDAFFASPYVRWEERRDGRDRMLAAIDERRLADFLESARRWDVSAVVVTGPESCQSLQAMFPLLTWRLKGDICVSVVRDRPQSGTARPTDHPA